MCKLKELENIILEWHLNKGLKLFKYQIECDSQWTFKTYIESEYKRKVLKVVSIVDKNETVLVNIDEEDADVMYNEAIALFKADIKGDL